MSKIYFFIFVSLTLLSCKGNESIKKEISRSKLYSNKPLNSKVNPSHKMTINIAGMTCEHACGGSIRMFLKETGAVSRVSFLNFDKDKKQNTAEIYFDITKISTVKMIQIIAKLNSGQFKTSKSSVAFLDTKTSCAERNSNQQSQIPLLESAALPSRIETPNLLSLIRTLLPF